MTNLELARALVGCKIYTVDSYDENFRGYFMVTAAIITEDGYRLLVGGNWLQKSRAEAYFVYKNDLDMV